MVSNFILPQHYKTIIRVVVSNCFEFLIPKSLLYLKSNFVCNRKNGYVGLSKSVFGDANPSFC